MTRSILWISSRAPSSPVSIGCVALPQPRSRMALAADTRAVAVASFDRMTPTRTLSAVLVWPRASERISVTVLGIGNLRFGVCDRLCERSDAIQRMDMAVTGLLLRFAARNDRRKICWPRDELNDLGAHENHPHTAIATRPANASDTRYAVMLASRYHSSCHCEEQSDEAIQRQAGLWIASLRSQ